MSKDIRNSQAGIAHLGLILVLVLVLGGVGFTAYRVVQSNNDSVSAQEQGQEQLDDAADDAAGAVIEDQDESTADDVNVSDGEEI